MIEQWVLYLAHLGFVVGCMVVAALLLAELGVWLGVLKRKGDNDEK